MSPRTQRYREIVEILSVHGFGFAVGAMGMTGRFPFRRGLPGHQRGRTYAQPEHLRLALEELGPTFVKIGQILSTRADLLPPDYLTEVARLQDDVAPVPVAVVLETITEELGAVTIFDTLDRDPLASASIGQAHAATVAGARVVVKVRRPGVVAVVTEDLELLQDLAVRANRHWEVARDHDVVGIAQEFAATLRNELDYLREGRNAERFAAAFAADPAVHIPAVLWEMTTSRVLTLERIEGVKIDDVDALVAAGIDRPALARRAAGVLCKMVFEDGFFHADPHPGNFFVEVDGRLGIIDFGMVGEIDDALRANLGDLLVAVMSSDVDGATDAVLHLNLSGGTVDRAALRADVGRLVKSFSSRSLADFPVTAVINDLLVTLRRHHLRMPADLALLFKTLIMAEGLGERLDPDFRLVDVLAPYAERLVSQRFSADALTRLITELTHDLRSAGAGVPRALRGLVEALEQGSVEGRGRAEELRTVLDQVDRVGNRIVAGVVAAAVVDGLGRTVFTAPDRWSALRGLMVLAEAGGLAALAAYLARTAPRDPGRSGT
ncbi:ABC1 kinase family protein [Georgenia muralis]|uniref:Ubiquinone biosynthesis protein n=1 Tax=Georgenia muralis TaxID=154117 RepID=A0A3N4ZS24_9MICO|nr:AarF/UbiB family protein [Georgenia muralis]RPF28272.1 ubiquinone biosynthesis protein [Georgenia muralis]